MKRRTFSLRTGVLLPGALFFGLRAVACAGAEDTPAAIEDAGGDGGPPASDLSASNDGSNDAPPTLTGPCSEDGWCLVDMPNDRAALYGIWGSSANDVWAVGSNGAVLHFGGSTWSEQRLLTDAGQPKPLFGIWGSGPHDVWAFSTTEILHAEGWNETETIWSTFEMVKRIDRSSSAVRGIWGSGPTDVWTLLGSVGAIAFPITRCWHSEGWAGGSVEQVAALDQSGATGNLARIWGTGPNDVWMVGESGKILHSDGFWGGAVQWTQVNSRTHSHLNDVWGTATDDVWAVGAKGTIRHFTYDEAGQLDWGTSDSTTTETLHAIWGPSATDVWVVGDEGTIPHGDGAGWTRSRLPQLPPATALYGIWGSGPDDVWVVGERVILHRGRATAGGTR